MRSAWFRPVVLSAWAVLSLAGTSFAFGKLPGGAALGPTHLRCEYRVYPNGLNLTSPRMSWTLPWEQRGAKQTSYRILVSSSKEKLAHDEGDLWDSGTVHSDETVNVVYAGERLQSRTRVWWKVRVGDKDGRTSDWSTPASWTMGLLKPSDWQAKWIAEPDSATDVARGPLNGYHSELAKSSDSAKWVAVDLGEPRLFDAVRLFPARPYDWQPDTPGFLFPLRFKVDVASRADFADARVVLERGAHDEPNPGTNAPLYRFAPTEARFVRIICTKLSRRDSDNFGFALAEMQVLNARTDLSKGATVLALDSIETGPWAKANLTDGVFTTVKPGLDGAALPATLVRKTFTLSGRIRLATAYATALGLYELRVNGRRVGKEVLAPEWTSYGKRVQCQVYDVTRLLRQGENAVGAYLGEGWYAGRLMAVGRFPYGTHPRFLLQLEVQFADGRTQNVVSDESWRCTTDGPIRSAGIYDGETYDARQEIAGWDEPCFDASSWQPATTFALAPQQLCWQPNEPIQIIRQLNPIRLTEPRPGTYVFDLGQNMVGWCRLQARGRAGQTVTIRHAEMLNDDGTLYTANLRGAPQVDRYTPRNDGPFSYEPRFTYHGFRYVELTGLARRPRKTAVLGRVFHSSSPVVGQFQCSNPSLNRLMQNILWTQRANLMSSPNDCPQRDERFGWMGDIQAFSQTAVFTMDLAAFFTKFAQDIRDDQADDGRFPDFAPHPGDPNKAFSGAPAWADAGVVIPWRAFQNYADTRLLAHHFDAARRWVDYVHTNNPDLIWARKRNNDYNDWLNGDWIKQTGWPEKGGSVPKEVFATAFFAHATELVAKMATVLGRKEEARRYGELFGQIKNSFNQHFVQLDGHIEGDTQGGYALALNFNLLPDDIRPKAARLLVDNIRRYQNHLSTGIQTTHRALLELTRNNYTDVAWQLLTNRSFPSWLYMLDNGATTMWERWDGYVKGRGFQDAGMNSFNHWAFGAVGEWVWRNVVGLSPDDSQPGWKHFFVAPRPGGGVTWAQGQYDSIRGRITCSWKIENGKLRLHAVVPPNTSASIRVPTTCPDRITESGRPVSPDSVTGEAALFEVEAGSYDFLAAFVPAG